MLFAHLWSKSKGQQESGLKADLGDLARTWRVWHGEAKAKMQEDVINEIYSVLRSDLNQGIWPTWLPIQRTIAQIEQQSREIHDLLEKLDQTVKTGGVVLAGEIRTILTWAGWAAERIEKLDSAAITPEGVVAQIASAVEEKLQRLNPQGPAGVAVTVPELKENLESFAGQFRPETRLPVYDNSMPPSAGLPRFASVLRTWAANSRSSATCCSPKPAALEATSSLSISPGAGSRT